MLSVLAPKHSKIMNVQKIIVRSSANSFPELYFKFEPKATGHFPLKKVPLSGMFATCYKFYFKGKSVCQ
jgi:hypothetical protein